jgi:hypothetical protein
MLRIIKGRRKDQSPNVVDFQKALAKKRLKLVEQQNADKKEQNPKNTK